MRRTEQDTLSNKDKDKVQILAEKFFPAGGQADLTDIESGTLPECILDIPLIVTADALQAVIQKLPNSKSLGLDSLPNKVIKNLKELIVEDLATIISHHFKAGMLLLCIWESTIITLYKAYKKDYSILESYYLITLKNSLAKLMEKVLAIVIIEIVEKHNLLLQNQIGARKH